MSAPIRKVKMESGKLGGNVKNAGTQTGSGGNSPSAIKNAVGMCGIGSPGYKKIKGTVSG